MMLEVYGYACWTNPPKTAGCSLTRAESWLFCTPNKQTPSPQTTDRKANTKNIVHHALFLKLYACPSLPQSTGLQSTSRCPSLPQSTGLRAIDLRNTSRCPSLPQSTGLQSTSRCPPLAVHLSPSPLAYDPPLALQAFHLSFYTLGLTVHRGGVKCEVLTT